MGFFSGFTSFVAGIGQWLMGLWKKFTSTVLGSAQKVDDKTVKFTIPHDLGQGLMREASANKGERILGNIPQSKFWPTSRRSEFGKDVKANIGHIGRWLGVYFEKELALYLIKTYQLQAKTRYLTDSRAAVSKIKQDRDAFLGMLQQEFRSAAGDDYSLNQFLKYTGENVKSLGDQMIASTQKILNCEKVTTLFYAASQGPFAGTTSDIALLCESPEGAARQDWSVKYSSKADVTIARWKPSQVQVIFGSRRPQPDHYFDELLASSPTPEQFSSQVLMELWGALTGSKTLSEVEVELDPRMFTSLVNTFVRGSKGVRLAGMNYTTRQSSLGDNSGNWSDKIGGQFEVTPDGELLPKEGATAKGRLGVYGDRATFIKFSYLPPGVAWNKATYLLFEVNQTNRYGRYIQVKMNSLLSQ